MKTDTFTIILVLILMITSAFAGAITYKVAFGTETIQLNNTIIKSCEQYYDVGSEFDEIIDVVSNIKDYEMHNWDCTQYANLATYLLQIKGYNSESISVVKNDSSRHRMVKLVVYLEATPNNVRILEPREYAQYGIAMSNWSNTTDLDTDKIVKEIYRGEIETN